MAQNQTDRMKLTGNKKGHSKPPFLSPNSAWHEPGAISAAFSTRHRPALIDGEGDNTASKTPNSALYCKDCFSNSRQSRIRRGLVLEPFWREEMRRRDTMPL